jgi:hypothetical protein
MPPARELTSYRQAGSCPLGGSTTGCDWTRTLARCEPGGREGDQRG